MSYLCLTVLMDTTKLSAKGQVVLPKRVREELGWAVGTEFVVERSGSGVLLRPRAKGRGKSVAALAGALRHTGRPVTLQAMARAIEVEAAKRHARGRY
jgi:AbrB family looped-hinge helix DNA binding protein